MNTETGTTPPPTTSNPNSRNGVDARRKCAREEPLQCLSIAFVVGLLFSILPLGRLVGFVVQLAFSLLRPVLVILGLMKRSRSTTGGSGTNQPIGPPPKCRLSFRELPGFYPAR
jgi:hypothetical protein